LSRAKLIGPTEMEPGWGGGWPDIFLGKKGRKENGRDLKSTGELSDRGKQSFWSDEIRREKPRLASSKGVRQVRAGGRQGQSLNGSFSRSIFIFPKRKKPAGNANVGRGNRVVRLLYD